MSSSLTPAELAILSLVAEQPRHGYEIEGVIEQRGMRAWTEIGFSSIYYLLKKLERKGLVTGETQDQIGPGKTRVVYRMLEDGGEILKQGVLEALSSARAAPPALLLGLGNLPVVGARRAGEALAQYARALGERERSLLAARSAQGSLPYFVQAMFDYSLTLLEAERQWVDRFREKLEAEDGEA